MSDDQEPCDLSTLSALDLWEGADFSELVVKESRKRATTSGNPVWSQLASKGKARAAEYRAEIGRRQGQGSTTVNHRNP